MSLAVDPTSTIGEDGERLVRLDQDSRALEHCQRCGMDVVDVAR